MSEKIVNAVNASFTCRHGPILKIINIFVIDLFISRNRILVPKYLKSNQKTSVILHDYLITNSKIKSPSIFDSQQKLGEIIIEITENLIYQWVKYTFGFINFVSDLHSD